jgi:cobalt-zinc-cadmium efflux system outer membrane protein
MGSPLRPSATRLRAVLRASAVAITLGAWTLAAPLAHAETPGEIAMSRAQALKLGAEQGPAVSEARAPLAASGSIHDASDKLLPYAPRVNAFAGRRTGAFGEGLELGASATQELSWRGLRGARRDVASAIERAAVSELDRARLAGAARALLAWLDVLEAQELLHLRGVALRDAEEIARVATARVDRGVAMPAEASLAAAEVGAAVLAERDAEGLLVDAHAALKLATGIPQTTPVRAAGDLSSDDTSPAPLPARRDHPALAAARADIDLARADARLTSAHLAPPFSVGVTYAREGTGEQLVTGTLSVPLPFLDPSGFDAARQRASVLSAEARAQRRRDELAHDVAVATHDREHTRDVRDVLSTRVLVPLREAVRLARAGYQAGTQDATGLLLLRQRLVAAEERLMSAAADVRRADVRDAVARGSLLDGAAR